MVSGRREDWVIESPFGIATEHIRDGCLVSAQHRLTRQVCASIAYIPQRYRI